MNSTGQSIQFDEEILISRAAHGDLDGDGVLSSFEVSGSLKPGGVPRTLPLEVIREVE